MLLKFNQKFGTDLTELPERTYSEQIHVSSQIAMSVQSHKLTETSSIIIEDREIEALMSEFNGDPKEAIRALLHDIALLAEDRDNSVSYGYVRGRLFTKIQNKPHSS